MLVAGICPGHEMALALKLDQAHCFADIHGAAMILLTALNPVLKEVILNMTGTSLFSSWVVTSILRADRPCWLLAVGLNLLCMRHLWQPFAQSFPLPPKMGSTNWVHGMLWAIGACCSLCIRISASN